ncbi:helix-turn-helix domain-containing protein [Pontibacter vulgaris]|uniref:helix-turn-helix domain-containing protein n=1 Tax=Pontibacter vulgaris TaxID=2905679 RepID=UPI001FA77327|nr:helix-turn-helix domain-containing protein [Pontibacter vulgaris]
MKTKEIYSEILENYNLQKSDAISFVNYRVGVAIDKTKMLDTISANIDKLTILCGDLKLEIRLHEANPLFATNNQQFYTTKQAADILNVSPDKIRQLINNGILSTKKINQRNWQIPNWSLEAYKNDLCNFLTETIESTLEIAVVDVLDDENNLLISLISKEGIHQVHEYQTRIKRAIATVYPEL